MWPAFTAIGVPLVAAALGFLRGDNSSRLMRRIKHTAEIAEMVKDIPQAKASINALLDAQARELRQREQARIERRINTANLTLAVLLLVITAAVLYGLLVWTLGWWPLGTGWIPLSLTAVATFFFGGLTIAGFAQIFKAPKEPKNQK